MNKNFQYYTNRNKYQGVCCVPRKQEDYIVKENLPVEFSTAPKRKIINYLIKEKFLSEFSTDEEKQKVLRNLGILKEISAKVSEEISKLENQSQLLDLLNEEISTNKNELLNLINEEILRSQTAESTLENRVNTLENNPSSDGIKHIIIRESQYNRLTEYENNTIYLVIKDWTFEDQFPIVFTDTTWKFGNQFPINLI